MKKLFIVITVFYFSQLSCTNLNSNSPIRLNCAYAACDSSILFIYSNVSKENTYFVCTDEIGLHLDSRDKNIIENNQLILGFIEECTADEFSPMKYINDSLQILPNKLKVIGLKIGETKVFKYKLFIEKKHKNNKYKLFIPEIDKQKNRKVYDKQPYYSIFEKIEHKKLENWTYCSSKQIALTDTLIVSL